MINKYVENAQNWLISCLRNGLAHSYDVTKNEWVKPYPEVTGYVLSYLCNSGIIHKNLVDAGDRLIAIQDESGGFPSFYDKNILFTFDTSQILIGLCALYKRTNEQKYLDSALKAGDFLIKMQMANGAFIPTFNIVTKEGVITKNIYKSWNGPFSPVQCKLTEGYNTLFKTTKDEKYLHHRDLLTKFYETADDVNYTHPQGYLMEGLYAGGKTDLVKEKIAKLILPRMAENGYIPYNPELPYAYVSGTIQLGILMFKVGFVEEATKVRDFGRLVQSKHNSGGLFQYADKDGNLDSHVHTEINSWGTKYFCELERLLNNG